MTLFGSENGTIIEFRTQPKQNVYSTANSLIKEAMNGYTDDHMVKFFGRKLEKNPPSSLYPNLQSERSMLTIMSAPQSQEARDLLLDYLVRELVDSHEYQAREKHKERRQKYVISCLGLVSTILTGATAVLVTYFGVN